MHTHSRLMVGVCVLIAFLVPPAITAQEPARQQTIEELRRQIDTIEKAMQEQIAALRRQIEAQQPGSAGMPPGVATPRSDVVISGAAHTDTFARDRETVARVDNAPLDAAHLGFLTVPGTPARVKVDGYAKLDAIVDARPAGNPDHFVPSSIPVGLADPLRTASTNLHIRQTRMNVDFRSPTDVGEFRTFAEIDFYGSDGAVDPRMRHAYGQLSNFLVGQTWTTFTDVDAFPDTLDFSGPVGMTVLRQAQVRYTHPFAPGQSLALAIEHPLTQAPVIGDHGAAYSPAPDFIARYRFERPVGHIQIGGLVRSLGYRVTDENTTKLGVGFNAAGVYKLPGGDHLTGYVVYGQGVARYIDNLAGLSADLDLNDAGTDVNPLPAFGTYAAYTHHWPRGFRSTGAFGYSSIDNTAGQSASAYHQSYYGAANLLWNPVGSLNVGIEYLFGTHELNDGDDAHVSRLQFAAKYDFFRKRPVAKKP